MFSLLEEIPMGIELLVSFLWFLRATFLLTLLNAKQSRGCQCCDVRPQEQSVTRSRSTKHCSPISPISLMHVSKDANALSEVSHKAQANKCVQILHRYGPAGPLVPLPEKVSPLEMTGNELE